MKTPVEDFRRLFCPGPQTRWGNRGQ